MLLAAKVLQVVHPVAANTCSSSMQGSVNNMAAGAGSRHSKLLVYATMLLARITQPSAVYIDGILLD